MQFRLTYQGPLRPTQRDPEEDQANPLADHKHQIRKSFHAQLKQLWATNKFLREHKLSKKLNWSSRPIADENAYWGSDEDLAPMWEVIANQNIRFGYRFVPLVRENISLLCALDILFLRRDLPGCVIHAGDIDNRIKTIIDALRMPNATQELAGNEKPGQGEDPFYCLLEDDKQVTQLSVETDTLLDPPTSDNISDQRLVHLVITVTLRPYHITNFNLSFA